MEDNKFLCIFCCFEARFFSALKTGPGRHYDSIIMKAKTMIYLEPEQLQALRREAAKKRLSLAAIVRTAIKQYLESGDRKPRVPREAYLKIVALGKSGRSDLAKHHDRYLAEALRREHSG